MKKTIAILSLVFTFLSLQAQKTMQCEKQCHAVARLIYCSCSFTNYGLPEGEVSYSFYALVADEGKAIHVDFYEDRGSEKQKEEYSATKQDVCKLAKMLADMKVEELNGYNVDEQMSGGTSYRIHMEYADGKIITARWFTHHPKPEAEKAYNAIHRFLTTIANKAK